MLANGHRKVADEGELVALLGEALRHHLTELEHRRLTIHIPHPKGGVPLGPDVPFHYTPELFIQLSGTTIFELPDETVTLGPGELCLIPRWMPHYERIYGTASRPFHNLVILHGQNELFFHLAHEEEGRPAGYIRSCLEGEGCSTLLGLMNGAAEMPRSNPHTFTTAVNGFLLAYFSVFLSMLEEAREATPQEPYPVTRARQLVLAYVHDPKLSVNWVAERLQLHPDYLSLLFRQTIGHSLQTYITRARLQRACELLQSSSLNIAQVAEAVGFRDASYFTRFFRQRMNTTPMEFRRATRRAGTVRSPGA